MGMTMAVDLKQSLKVLVGNDERFNGNAVLMDLPHMIERVKRILDTRKWSDVKQFLKDLEITHESVKG